MRTRLIAGAIASGALLVAGCGSDSGGGSSQPVTAASGDVAITIKNIQFDPKTIAVKVGQKITWTNEDGIAHNVTAQEGADFKSDDLNKGQTFSFTPEKAGTIKYVCTIHPGQNGEITVES